MIVVHFFGGYQATQAQVDAWAASARAQRPDVTFEGIPYPQGASSGDPLAKVAPGELDLMANAVKQTSADTHYIVGHSSGCAVANPVAAIAVEKGAKNFTLIALDGFRPSPALLALPTTTCWSATCEGHHSLNYFALAGTPRFRVYPALAAHGVWALHFSLVNRNSMDLLVKVVADGYKACAANLCFLEGVGNAIV